MYVVCLQSIGDMNLIASKMRHKLCFSFKMNIDTGRIDANLTISNVTKDTFKIYNLIASNQIGTSRHSIAFNEGKQGGKTSFQFS